MLSKLVSLKAKPEGNEESETFDYNVESAGRYCTS